MDKILVIFREKTEKAQKVFNLIQERIGDKVELESCFGFNAIEIKLTKDLKLPSFQINGKDLKQYSKVIMYTVGERNWDISSLIAQYCEYNNIKVLNSREKYFYHAGKILQKVILPFHNLLIPKFYFNTNLEELSYSKIKEELGEKFVAKQSKATLGKKVKLIQSEEEFNTLKNQIKQNQDNEGFWFFEEFIEHSYSVRGIVTGDECKVRITVQKELDNFKTNHGVAKFEANTDENFGAMCVKAAKALKLEISGVDTVLNAKNNELYVFEVNKSPGITVDDFVSPEIDVISDLILKY